jgi:hypothetical protein
MPDWRILQAKISAARQEVRNLQIEQMKPGQPPDRLELLRNQERSARAAVKQARDALEQQQTRESWRRIWRRSPEH